MSSQPRSPAVMSIDFKKNRIRVHRAVLHTLGDPKYNQFLVHPTEMVVAIRCVDKPLSGEPVHKVIDNRARDFSHEIYSRSFLLTLAEIVPGIDTKYLYRMTGEVIPSKQMAVFSLKTLRKIDV